MDKFELMNLWDTYLQEKERRGRESWWQLLSVLEKEPMSLKELFFTTVR